MKTSIIISKYAQTIALLAILVSAISFAAIPAQAHAGNFLDPFCLWSCSSGHKKAPVVTPPTTTTSGGSTVNNYYNTNTNTNTNTGTTPVVATGGTYNPYPTYPTTYYPTYPTQYYPSTPLTGSCYSMSQNISVGSPVTWYASANGGNGVYTYSWNGSDGFSGYGPTISTTYSYPGTKIANVTVTSNGQSVSIPCSSSIIVSGGYAYGYDNSYAYQYQQPVVYQQPVYQQQPIYTNGNYNYNNGNLQIACAVDSTNVAIGTAVTWSVEATGGAAPYSYSWTGSDGFHGSQASVVTAYTSVGTKNATVSVTSADGRTSSASCSNTVNVRGRGAVGGSTGTTTVKPATTGDNSGLSAASLFSLSNIPWGWVAVLVILVLFGTIMYLIFNKNKI